MIRRPDRFFTVAGNSFIDCYCNEPDFVRLKEEAIQDDEKRCAVFTSTQRNCDAILGDNHHPGSDSICYTLLDINDKMKSAEVTAGKTLVGYRRFITERTHRCVRVTSFCSQGSTSMRYPDDQDLIICFNNRVPWYHFPVP